MSRIFSNLLGNYHVHNVFRSKLNRQCLGNYTNLSSKFNVSIKYRHSVDKDLFESLGNSVYQFAYKHDKFGEIFRQDKSIPSTEGILKRFLTEAIFIDFCIVSNVLNKGLDNDERKMSRYARENFEIYLERRPDFYCLPLSNNFIQFKVNYRRTDEITLKTNLGLTKALEQQQATACTLISTIEDHNDLQSILVYLKSKLGKGSVLQDIESVSDIKNWDKFSRHHALLLKLHNAKCLEFTRPSVDNNWKSIGDYMSYTSTESNKETSTSNALTSTYYEIGLDSDGLDQYTCAFNALYQIHLVDQLQDPTFYKEDPFLIKDLKENGYNYSSSTIASKYLNFVYTLTKHSVNNNDDIVVSSTLNSGYHYLILNERQKEVMHSLALGVSLDAPIGYESGTSNSNPSEGPKSQGPTSGPSTGPSSPIGDNIPSKGGEGGIITESSSSEPSSGTSSSQTTEDINSFALSEQALYETLTEAVSNGDLDESETPNIVSKIGKQVRTIGSSSAKLAGSLIIQQAINKLTNKGEIPPIVQQNYNNNYSLVNHMDAEFTGVRNSLALGLRSK